MASAIGRHSHHFHAGSCDGERLSPFCPGKENLESAVLRAEEEERRRIAREIHDVALQELVVIQFGIASIREDLADRSDIEAICRNLQVSVSTIQHDLRTLSYVLHPPELSREGLSFALRTFVEGFSRRTGLTIRYADALGDDRLDPEVEIALYRVAREALFNIARHARASEAEVSLVRTVHRLTLTVRDNGIGIREPLTSSAKAGSAGVGLASMRERMAALDGTLAIRRLAQGTLVRAQVPLQPIRWD
ncbi:sensor histidine kinase [Sphingomonas sp. DT-207]|uniref:sensor histidine kinase n=1 Tax=Sphingomonas sp. DT-207 TaxID=3396167 RepID=UPI003F1A9912